MAFDLQTAATVAKVGFVLTPIILLLFFIQSVWGAVDAAHPTNPVSDALKKAGVYNFVGGKGSSAPSGDSAALDAAASGGSSDLGGLVYSSVMACLTGLLLVAYGFGVYYAVKMEKFNPFAQI